MIYVPLITELFGGVTGLLFIYKSSNDNLFTCWAIIKSQLAIINHGIIRVACQYDHQVSLDLIKKSVSDLKRCRVILRINKSFIDTVVSVLKDNLRVNES